MHRCDSVRHSSDEFHSAALADCRIRQVDGKLRHRRHQNHHGDSVSVVAIINSRNRHFRILRYYCFCRWRLRNRNGIQYRAIVMQCVHHNRDIIRNHKFAVVANKGAVSQGNSKVRTGCILNDNLMGDLIADIAASILHIIGTLHNNRAITNHFFRMMYRHIRTSFNDFHAKILQFGSRCRYRIIAKHRRVASVNGNKCNRVIDDWRNAVKNGDDVGHGVTHVTT